VFTRTRRVASSPRFPLPRPPPRILLPSQVRLLERQREQLRAWRAATADEMVALRQELDADVDIRANLMAERFKTDERVGAGQGVGLACVCVRGWRERGEAGGCCREWGRRGGGVR
jgi:hypothetical protein